MKYWGDDVVLRWATSLRSSERGLKCRMIDGKTVDDTVAPFVGAWIEMLEDLEWNVDDDVAPFVGAWIEITGLNSTDSNLHVAPFVGAWIEILEGLGRTLKQDVAPFVGAWIEIRRT